MKDYDPNGRFPAKAKQAAGILAHIWQSRSDQAGVPVTVAVPIQGTLEYFQWNSLPKKLGKRLAQRNISLIQEANGNFLVLVSMKDYEICQLVKS